MPAGAHFIAPRNIKNSFVSLGHIKPINKVSAFTLNLFASRTIHTKKHPMNTVQFSHIQTYISPFWHSNNQIIIAWNVKSVKSSTLFSGTRTDKAQRLSAAPSSSIPCASWTGCGGLHIKMFRIFNIRLSQRILNVNVHVYGFRLYRVCLCVCVYTLYKFLYGLRFPDKYARVTCVSNIAVCVMWLLVYVC